MKYLLTIIASLFLTNCGGSGSIEISKEVIPHTYKLVISGYDNLYHFHFNTIDEINTYYSQYISTAITTKDSKNLIIDSRYITPPVIDYIDNSFYCNIDLNSKHIQNIEYGGINYSIGYYFDDTFYLWKNTKGLMLQSYFVKPTYINRYSNDGGGISFVLFLYNPKLKTHLNYVISVYGLNKGVIEEDLNIHYDPTTNIAHIQTAINYNTLYTTISPYSNISEKITYNDNLTDDYKFYRVLITTDDLKYLLDRLKSNPPPELAGVDFGDNPEDWILKSAMVQFELEENGNAVSEMKFRNFEIYTIEE